MSAEAPLIYAMWYVAAASEEIVLGKMVAKKILGQKIILARMNEGKLFALRDFCPHRGMPLSYGVFDGQTVECCYHGWRFNCEGRCTLIPSLTPDDKVDITRIKAKAYPCLEQNGVIWVYMTAPNARVPEELPPLPESPVALAHPYYCVESVSFPCNIDHAVIGLMDPSHGPFVHASWWWRSKRSMHVKQKKFAPYKLGFKMVSHKPSANSRAYKILGGTPTTEITFQLPGLRTEHITIGKRHIVLLTALTPVDEHTTELHQFMYSTIPLVNALKSILSLFGRAFIKQDLQVVKKQQEGLQNEHPSLMLLGDADQQALWYFRLKKDWLEAQATGQPFENRIPEKLLSWQS